MIRPPDAPHRARLAQICTSPALWAGASQEDEVRGAGTEPGQVEAGFILPYVLAVIFVISLLTVITARAVGSAQDRAIETRDRQVLTADLNQAEEIILHTFQRAPALPSGLDLSGRSVDAFDLIDRLPDGGDLTPEAIWLADGGLRFIRLSEESYVEVRYQDADGLVSVNATGPELIERWLARVGGPFRDAQGLAAKLSDYRDQDNFRQYRGGERADYRQLQRPVPTNSSLRSPQEMRSILGWEEVDLIEEAHLLDELTWFFTSAIPREGAMPDKLEARLALDQRSRPPPGETDIFSEVFATSPLPGPRAQFTLTACLPTAGRCLRRLVEIEKTPDNADYPYQRRLIAEFPVSMPESPPTDAVFLFSQPGIPDR